MDDCFISVPLYRLICFCKQAILKWRGHLEEALHYVHTLTQMKYKTWATPEGVSLGSPNHTDHENHSGTYSGKDPLLKRNHHSLRCTWTPVGKASVTAASNCAGPQQGLKPQRCKSKQFLGEPLPAKLIHIFLGELLHTKLQTNRSRKFWESIFISIMILTRGPKIILFQEMFLYFLIKQVLGRNCRALWPSPEFSCKLHW